LSHSLFGDGEMIEITWLGRGGQGAVTAAELLAIASIEEEKTAIAIPEFGAERRGAPVRAYNRMSSKKGELPKTPVISPDILVIIDPSLVSKAELYVNFNKIKYIVANTPLSREEVLKALKANIPASNVYMFDGSKAAMEIFGRPIYNTVMLGALIGAVPLVKPSSLENAVKKSFSGKLAELNLKAISIGMNRIRESKAAGVEP